MQLSTLRGVYEAEGPFATVYLEARSPSAEAANEIRLRWHDLRSQLAHAGTSEAALTSLDEALASAKAQEVQAEGRVLVADRSRVVLEERFDAAQETGDLAVLAEPPQLGAYIRHRLAAARMLVAIADQKQAVIRRLVVTGDDLLDAGSEETVRGSVESVHKPREGAMSHKRIQRSADEAAARNIRDIAAGVAEIADSWRPDVIVVAGEIQGRRALHEELPHALRKLTVEAETGGGIPSGSADEGTEEALREELSVIARRVVIRRADEQTERLGEARGKGRSAEDPEAIRAALRLGAVETLLLRPRERDPEEDELLAGAAGVGASVGILGTQAQGSVAAILRYEVPFEDLTD
ncbi:hypothetical protein LTH96_08615 [Nesterenkonia sp. LB17]|uniref:baeRF2 domain-containing protein n=1 Tax=Nesterenkonia sp. LB17 TaxID=2901230 RepID=UPI001F4CBCAD|nr:hypothetical protein [Nesterenkonia sp. LB17]MCH8565777.1 hypothetical protein [Nesterenkonia sp. LB17]